MGKGTAQASDPAAGAAVVVRAVVHARAHRLQVGHLRPVWLSSSPAPLQRFVLDVNNHAVAIPSEGRTFLCVPPLVLAVHSQKTEHDQVQEGSDDCQAHKDIHETKGHV